MKKDVFLRTRDFGRLYIDIVLLEYIYPRVFICTNSKKMFLLFYEMDSDNSGNSWFVCVIDKNTKRDLINKRISIQSAYKNANEDDLYAIENFDNIVNIHKEYKKMLKKLPKKDVYSEYEGKINKKSPLVIAVSILAGIALVCAIVLIVIILTQK